jgi:pimeloyl-ACP methyl ester carboxylesterase
MPKVNCGHVVLNYEQQGSGEPLILIPYTGADHACYAFQVTEYSKHFTCFSLDLRGTGESERPEGAYTTETLADDVAAFLQATKIDKAHVLGLSLGAAIGMWLAAKYSDKVVSLGVHSGWPNPDPFIRAVVEGWRSAARGMQSVADVVIQVMFPWCFTPETYGAKPDYMQSLADFVRSRPSQSVDSYLQQTSAVLKHDVLQQLHNIKAPTQITFGQRDVITSTRFANVMISRIRNAELLVFEGCSHATIYESVEEFNERTLEFLKRNTGGHRAAANALARGHAPE